MKNRYLIPSIVLLFIGAHLMARQSPSANQTAPCNDQASIENKGDSTEKKKESIEHDPLADPAEELRVRAQKKMDEKMES